MIDTLLVKIDMTFFAAITMIIISIYFLRQIDQKVRSVKILKYITISNIIVISISLLTSIGSHFNFRIGEITYSTVLSAIVVLNNFSLLCTVLYLRCEVDEEKLPGKRIVIPLVVILGSITILAIVGTITGEFITYSYDTGYVIGTLYKAANYIKLLILIYGICEYIKLGNKMDIGEKRIFLFLSTIGAISIITEVFISPGFFYYNIVILSYLIVISFSAVSNRHLIKDSTTQVSSFNAFEDFLFNLEKDAGKEYAIAAIDIDGFEDISKKYGISESEKILYKTAKSIERGLKGKNLISRYRSDKFFIYLDTTSKENIEEIILLLDTNLRNENMETNKPYTISFTYVYEILDKSKHSTYIDLLEEVEYKLYTKKNDKNENEDSMLEESMY